VPAVMDTIIFYGIMCYLFTAVGFPASGSGR